MVNHLLVLGGNGRVGTEVVKLALERGIRVNALVRRPAEFAHTSELLTTYEGSPMDAEAVQEASDGADGVISTLNNGRASDNPWAKPTSPKDLMEVSIGNALAAMSARDIRRIAVLSAAGVGDSFQHSPWVFRQLMTRTNMKQAFDDHNAVEVLLRASGVEWTLARAMGLSGKPSKGELVLSYNNEPKPAMMIPRETVARFLIDSLDDESLIGRAPVISER